MIDKYIIPRKENFHQGDISPTDISLYNPYTEVLKDVYEPEEDIEVEEKYFKEEKNVVEGSVISRVKGNIKINYNPLKQIEKEIRRSEYILKLDKDWDQFGAEPIEKQIHSKAIIFLRLSALKLYEEKGTIIEAPEINPCPDGSIDMSWRANDARLLINFRKKDDKYIAFYYGDSKNDEEKYSESFKGNALIPNLEKHLLPWMEEKLRK